MKKAKQAVHVYVKDVGTEDKPMYEVSSKSGQKGLMKPRGTFASFAKAIEMTRQIENEVWNK